MRLHKLAEEPASTHHALVHGDVSPKKILVGAEGPVILDAECAWYDEAAFDVALFLNHLLLKCLVNLKRERQVNTMFEDIDEDMNQFGRVAESR